MTSRKIPHNTNSCWSPLQSDLCRHHGAQMCFAVVLQRYKYTGVSGAFSLVPTSSSPSVRLPDLRTTQHYQISYHRTKCHNRAIVQILYGKATNMHATTLALSLAAFMLSNAQAYVIKVDSHDGPLTTHEVHSSNLTAEEFLSSKKPVRFRRETRESLDERDCTTNSDFYYTINGDGDPHQNYKIAQVANTLISCPGTVSTGESHTFEWSITGSANGGTKDFTFGALGFSVGESDTQTVSDAFACTPGVGMTEICALHYTAVTAVSVELWEHTISCGNSITTDLGPGTVYLPNSGGIGSTMSRGTNFGGQNIIQCRGQDAREIDFFCGPAGGPEYFETTGYGPWQPSYMNALDPAGCPVPIEAMQFDSGN